MHGTRKHTWRTQAAWAKIISHTGVSPKWVKSKRRRKREKERLNDGNNNGQLRIATPPRVAHAKPPGPKERTMVITMARLCMAHASTHGARKPPGPIIAYLVITTINNWMRCLAIVITNVQSFFFSLSPSFAFDPIRGISRVWKVVSPNILA